MHIDYKKLEGAIADPLWYLEFAPILRELNSLRESNPAEYEGVKEGLYQFFEDNLTHRRIALGNEIGIWDDERLPIDTAVLHHTGNFPWMSPERLSAIELMRLYAPAYASPSEGDKAKTSGKPISSGHVRGGQQFFWPYHYLIRPTGNYLSLLDRHEVGWHAGNWNVNCRSIAICFDGDFENGRPSDMQIRKAADIINRYRISKERVFGHCEVNPKTVCPSRLFLSEGGRRGWKEDLLEMI